MSYIISHYLCSGCLSGSPYIADLQTGSFIGSSTGFKSYLVHCSPNPNKPANGVFLETGRDTYESGAREFGYRGFAAIETNGTPVLFVDFKQPIARIEFSGISGFLTPTGKMVRVDNPDLRHWFGFTGFAAGSSGICSICGTGIF